MVPSTPAEVGLLDRLDARVHRLPPWALPVGAAGVALGACIATAFVNPYVGDGPPCPFHALTGLWCPGCGSSRMLWSLTHGDVAAAFARNPLALVVLPYLCWAWAGWMLDSTGGPHLWRLPHKRWIPIAALVVICLYWVARNLPWAPFRVLGPG